MSDNHAPTNGRQRNKTARPVRIGQTMEEYVQAAGRSLSEGEQQLKRIEWVRYKAAWMLRQTQLHGCWQVPEPWTKEETSILTDILQACELVPRLQPRPSPSSDRDRCEWLGYGTLFGLLLAVWLSIFLHARGWLHVGSVEQPPAQRVPEAPVPDQRPLPKIPPPGHPGRD